VEHYVPTSSNFIGPRPLYQRPTLTDDVVESSGDEHELQEYVEKRQALIAAVASVRSLPRSQQPVRVLTLFSIQDAEELEKWVKVGASGRGQAQQDAKKARLEGCVPSY
jgi:hypothetical protein